MQEFLDEVCETPEEWILWWHIEIAYENRKAGGKEFTYDDVKWKVLIKRVSYVRNQKLIEELSRRYF